MLINEKAPFDEDVGILDGCGNVKAVVVTSEMYDCLLRKSVEKDGGAGMEALASFHVSSETNHAAEKENDIPSFRLNDIVGFRVWAEMLVNNHEDYTISDVDTAIDFFGEDEAMYLVINVYTSETSAVEYVFLAADEANRGKTVELIFDFLKTVNYSLHELLIWLANADYQETEIGNRVYVGGITISCDKVRGIGHKRISAA